MTKLLVLAQSIAIAATLLGACGGIDTAPTSPDAVLAPAIDSGATPDASPPMLLDAGAPDSQPSVDTMRPAADTGTPRDSMAADSDRSLCSGGYQRIIFNPSDEQIYCIPIIGTDAGHVANPCGYGHPTEFHTTGVVECSYDAVTP